MRLALGAAIGLAALVVALGAHAGSLRVPRGFDPESVSAATPTDVRVLGTYPCGSGWCNAIVQSSDGRRFARISAPPLPTQGDVPQLRFADRRNGYAFVDSLLYATHDGGMSWRHISLGTIFGFATSAGRAYVLAGHCRATSCGPYRLRISSVSADVWRTTATHLIAPADVAALGQNVWILGSGRSGESLLRSADGGRTFVTGHGPCFPDLGGRLSPASADVLWAVCPTGMLAGASKSIDGGVSFEKVAIPRCCINAMRLDALSTRVAVVAPSAPGRPTFLHTTDGGRSWSSSRTPARTESVFSLDFVNARLGFALVQLAGEHQALWRTTDAGASWRAFPIR